MKAVTKDADLIAKLDRMIASMETNKSLYQSIFKIKDEASYKLALDEIDAATGLTAEAKLGLKDLAKVHNKYRALSTKQFLDTMSAEEVQMAGRMESSGNIIANLKAKGLLKYGTGEATEKELAALHLYTENGDFLNAPMRENGVLILDPAVDDVYELLNSCLDKLAKVDERLVTDNVLRGRSFTKEEFALFESGNSDIPLKGFVSATSKDKIATAFFSTDPEMVPCVLVIKPKAGVYIDDISDYGTNLDGLGKLLEEKHFDEKGVLVSDKKY